MKKILLAVCALFAVTLAHAQDDEQLVVENTTPGKLAQQLGAELYTCTNLKVTGSINNADLKVLRQMAGFMPDIIPDDYWDDYAKPAGNLNLAPRKGHGDLPHDPSECSLAILDVSEVHLVTGGGNFFEDEYLGTKYSIQKEGVAPDFMFERCYNLVSLKLPNELKKLPRYCVSHCDALVDLQLGDKIRTIDDYSLTNNASLLSLTIPEGVVSIGREGCSRNVALETLTLPSTLTEVGYFAFCSNYALQNINLGTGLKKLTYGAFKWCDGLEYVDLSDTNLEIIDAFAFSSCTSLETVKFPVTLISIGSSAFEQTPFLEEIDIPEGLETIGNNAFYNSGLRTFTLPNSVTSIGTACFSDCKLLENFTLSENITWIPDRCFSSCNSLVSLDLPERISEIGPSAFSYCKSLTDLNFSSGLQYIDEQAFYGCEALEEVTVPDNVLEIGKGIFRNCTSLKEASIGSGIETLPMECFYGCSSLSKLNLVDGIKTLQRFAFEECTSLNTIILPATVEVLENGLSFLWGNVQKIVCYATVPPVSNSASGEPWYSCYKTARVYVPEESIPAYIQSPVWKKFYEENDFLTIDDYLAEQGDDETTAINSAASQQAASATLYDLSGHQLTAPTKGINLVRMSNGAVKKVVVK